MKRLPLLWLIILIALSGCEWLSDSDENPAATLQDNRRNFWEHLPPANGSVNDFEELYTSKEELHLDSIIGVFEDSTGIEVALVTIDTARVEAMKFDDLILHMADSWNVGEYGYNKGVVIGISKGYRKMRIQNSRGVEKMFSDAETQAVIDQYFIPGYRKGNYYEGTLTGLTELMKQLTVKNVEWKEKRKKKKV